MWGAILETEGSSEKIGFWEEPWKETAFLVRMPVDKWMIWTARLMLLYLKDFKNLIVKSLFDVY